MKKDLIISTILTIGFCFSSSIVWAGSETPANITKIAGNPVAVVTPGYLPVQEIGGSGGSSGPATVVSKGVTVLPTPVSNNSFANSISDVFGRQFLAPNFVPRQMLSYFNVSTSSTPTTFIAAKGSGIFTDIMPGLIISSFGLSAGEYQILNGATVVREFHIDFSGSVDDIPPVIFREALQAPNANAPWIISITDSGSNVVIAGDYSLASN
ncbi:MAG: hypothetical protein ACREL1_00390 [bacterium]